MEDTTVLESKTVSLQTGSREVDEKLRTQFTFVFLSKEYFCPLVSVNCSLPATRQIKCKKQRQHFECPDAERTFLEQILVINLVNKSYLFVICPFICYYSHGLKNNKRTAEMIA